MKEPPVIDFKCVHCHGTGIAQCGCCNQDTDCDWCEGSGINDEAVDCEAFDAAQKEMWKKHGGYSWAVMDDDEKLIGRAGGNSVPKAEWTLYYRDFPPKPKGNP